MFMSTHETVIMLLLMCWHHVSPIYFIYFFIGQHLFDGRTKE